MNPESSGRRDSPPPSLRVAIGGNNPPFTHTIVIDLLNPAERDAFVSAFGKLMWRTHAVEDELDLIAVGDDEPDVFLTDDPQKCRQLPHLWDRIRSPAVVLVDDREAAIEGAWAAGAAWVIVRPVDPRDPLGFKYLDRR